MSNGFYDWLDGDNDGSVLDDTAKAGTQAVGGLMGCAEPVLDLMGSVSTVGGGIVGAGLMAGGGALLSAGMGAEVVPGLQIPGGVAMGLGAGIIGAGMGVAGAGYGLGLAYEGAGNVMGMAGEFVAGTGANVAEEVGDFTADLFGTRGAPPSSEPVEDPFYRDGRTDGLGQQLNQDYF